MPELMNHVEFRTALENAIKGKSANKAPFSIAWASGKLSRAHLARWAENHYHYVGPFADYLAYIYARMPERLHRGQGLPARQHVRGGDRRRSPHRPADPLRGGLRHHARARDRSRQHDRDDPRPAELVLCGGDARGSDRRGGRSRRGPGIAGAVDLPQADADAARQVQVHRRGGRVLRPAHRLRRDPRRARLPDRAGARQHGRAAAALPQDLRESARRCGCSTPPRSIGTMSPRTFRSSELDIVERKVPRTSANCCRRDQVPTVILHRDGQTYQRRD